MYWEGKKEINYKNERDKLLKITQKAGLYQEKACVWDL